MNSEKMLNIASFVLLIIALFHGVWHLGRLYEHNQEKKELKKELQAIRQQVYFAFEHADELIGGYYSKDLGMVWEGVIFDRQGLDYLDPIYFQAVADQFEEMGELDKAEYYRRVASQY